MSRFTHRSTVKELLDGDDIPFEDIRQNMQELDRINSLLGGHRISLEGFKSLAGHERSLHVCEIGCGGGDNLKVMHEFAKRQGIDIRLTGVDIKDSCIEFARSRNQQMNASWICSDYKRVSFPNGQPDIIFSSLFCHHFREPELVEMLQWMKANSGIGFFINDLHRHTLAYYSIKLITRIFSRSYLVKNDAPLSVARGFIKSEWQQIFRQAAIAPVDIRWRWAFRHLIIYRH